MLAILNANCWSDACAQREETEVYAQRRTPGC